MARSSASRALIIGDRVLDAQADGVGSGVDRIMDRGATLCRCTTVRPVQCMRHFEDSASQHGRITAERHRHAHWITNECESKAGQAEL